MAFLYEKIFLYNLRIIQILGISIWERGTNDYQELKEISKINNDTINLHYGVAVMKKADKDLFFKRS
ncbi:hypothetical protein [Emticicia sp.]|uniref:hypothetical protein n=1 Tax=Emticicia sp. TaxID=1930953 RepID=UPI0037530445